MKKETVSLNVAPSSTSGHIVSGAEKITELHEEKEIFFVNGPSVMTNDNHMDIVIPKSALVTTQVVFNPFKRMYENSKD